MSPHIRCLCARRCLCAPLTRRVAGAQVTGRITKVSEGGKVEMSFKGSADASKPDKYKYEDLSAGQVVKCTVKRLETYGLFLAIRNTGLVGLCHKTEVSDKVVKDVTKLYSPGDYVKAVVLKLNPKKRQISLGLKPSYLEANADESSEEDDADENDEEGEAAVAEKEEEEEEEEEEESSPTTRATAAASSRQMRGSSGRADPASLAEFLDQKPV